MDIGRSRLPRATLFLFHKVKRPIITSTAPNIASQQHTAHPTQKHKHFQEPDFSQTHKLQEVKELLKVEQSKIPNDLKGDVRWFMPMFSEGSLHFSKSEDLMTRLSPQLFESVLFEIHHSHINVDPLNGNVAVKTSDLLIHVYSSQFKNIGGLHSAFDVLCFLSRKGLFPSLRTCTFLLSSLVKANELQKCCEVFDLLRGGMVLDAHTYSVAIYAFCKGGRLEKAVKLFQEMEDMGVVPNVITYNHLIQGLCEMGSITEAIQFKERMTQNGVNPNLYTYSMLINALVKQRKLDEANTVWKEMVDNGLKSPIVMHLLGDTYLVHRRFIQELLLFLMNQ